ncbi:MAG: Nif3-like dinuclear metal center hexameric protein [Reichenbachiella sp.]
MKISEVVQVLNQWAPPAYQESYDNAGLTVGDPNTKITGILISLDCTEPIVQEAIDTGCNLIIAHHPIVFKGLKSFTGKNYVERTVIKAIKNDIAIFSIHTNLDSINTGVNQKICDLIGLKDTRILFPKSDTLIKLESFVPLAHHQSVLDAIYQVGAGQIGNYDHCSFSTEGMGSFRPNDQAIPFVGNANEDQLEQEKKIEIMLPKHLKSKVISVLKKAHPYEEVAYYITAIQNKNQEVGSGMVGQLDSEMNVSEFLQKIKSTFNLSIIKHTALIKDKVKKIAVCGGSGSFLLEQAKGAGADIYITADFKYHEYFDADNQIVIADIGHYESEVFTKDLIYDFLNEKITNIALNLSKENTNPVKYS